MPWSAWAHSHTDFNTQREFAASSAAIQLGIVALISKRDQSVNVNEQWYASDKSGHLQAGSLHADELWCVPEACLIDRIGHVRKGVDPGEKKHCSTQHNNMMSRLDYAHAW